MLRVISIYFLYTGNKTGMWDINGIYMGLSWDHHKMLPFSDINRAGTSTTYTKWAGIANIFERFFQRLEHSQVRISS